MPLLRPVFMFYRSNEDTQTFLSEPYMTLHKSFSSENISKPKINFTSKSLTSLVTPLLKSNF